MVQAADCSDEDPLVEFDSPALAREDDLCAGLFEGRMKFRNDSKKSRWDLASDGFWSKKSIRELLSLLLLRHGRVCLPAAKVDCTTNGEGGASLGWPALGGSTGLGGAAGCWVWPLQASWLTTCMAEWRVIDLGIGRTGFREGDATGRAGVVPTRVIGCCGNCSGKRPRGKIWIQVFV